MTAAPAAQTPVRQAGVVAHRPLRTDRLDLRPIAPADALRVAQLVGVWDVARNLSTVPHPYTLDHADAFIAKMQASAAEGVAYVFAVCAADGALIGCCGLHLPEGQPDFELGYWLGAPYWGQGLMTEAAGAVRDWACRDLRQTRLTSGHFVDNPASGKVLVKLGFSYTGENNEQTCLARGAAVTTRRLAWLSPGRRLS